MNNYDNNNKGALWIKTAKNTGKKFMSGSIQIDNKLIKISVFKNDRKQNDNHPDYNIIVNTDDNNYKAPVDNNNNNNNDVDDCPF